MGQVVHIRYILHNARISFFCNVSIFYFCRLHHSRNRILFKWSSKICISMHKYASVCNDLKTFKQREVLWIKRHKIDIRFFYLYSSAVSLFVYFILILLTNGYSKKETNRHYRIFLSLWNCAILKIKLETFWSSAI